MSRIAARFRALAAAGRKALVTYVTAGDPDPRLTVPLLHDLVEAGADLIEVGVPFSDPMADGPVIQKGIERALVHSVRLVDVLDMVRSFRERDDSTPVILMGYLNPIEVLGYETVARAAEAAGVDGFIIVDLPPEESEDAHAVLREHGLDMIFLVAPTSGDERIRRIAERASGFIYYVSLKGVTGASNLDTADVARQVAAVKARTDLPVGVGFGIGDGETAAAVAAVSDAVVVGSAIVRRIGEHQDDPEALRASVKALVAEMRAAMDSPRAAA